MPIAAALGIIALALLAYKSGALEPFGIAAPVTTAPIASPSGLQPNVSVTAPPAVTSPGGGTVTSANTTGLAITGAATVGTAAVAAPSSLAVLGLTGAAAGAALAGIGAVAAIAAALWAAHEQRKAQATSENTATNLGVQGFDSDMRTVNQAYNSRQIDATSAIQLVQQIMAQYWALVTPRIQPGRNGCQGGGVCPTPQGGKNPCTGNIGAACCVGCYDLTGSPQPTTFPGYSGPMYFGAQGTIAVLQQGGGTVYYQQVFGSSYGGKDRAAYTLLWQQTAVN